MLGFFISEVGSGVSGSDADEQKIKEETGATLRCIPFDQAHTDLTCFLTGGKAAEVAIFAKAH